ncbi:hypothetical protein PQ469_18285 [Mucilaginibacter sp. KACC 22773]|jgi:hypothetical protein|uniref:hypothetical protein n=1 Tax=Mucilaginibacter sp. KACC 22773 TaxID=3025671 RepID=UPI0023651D60|nr:hypothetical protein [Mucilaginibacter sp. KACC 22773]WDF75839.1 hypothetical protein PQ469_18285 [Mucilaginibacter sp. KACC 22773]
MIITIKDETFAGKILHELEIEFKTETVSVQDIITGRVIKEVENYNNKLPEYFNGLIEPSDVEKTLNGFKLKPKKVIDAEKQVYVALNAFQNNGFFVLIDNIQSESLDQQIALRKDTTISFIKLTPLVGG